MTDADRQKLTGVHPQLVERLARVMAAMDALGHPMIVTDGLRTVERQRQLYAQGRTAPGPIVTHCDGTEKRSNHQAKIDKLGHAVDCAFLVDGKPSWNVELPWHAYGAAAEAVGLVWGGSWKSLTDLPHVELS